MSCDKQVSGIAAYMPVLTAILRQGSVAPVLDDGHLEDLKIAEEAYLEAIDQAIALAIPQELARLE